ncbi:MAG: DUF1573 domain-containing protein [Prevotellaceae bacterium]|jgi:hypothetical protein|nr:DUF1573 domain-containing protein [Prevotellaceae bacterium]
MKRIVWIITALLFSATAAWAQSEAAVKKDDTKRSDIKFDATTHNFGTFSEEKPVTCTFTFTNTGDVPLVIHQAIASCGCTIPEYTEEPVLPGKKGTIKVTYDGSGKMPGHFKKSITLRTNAKTEMVRLFIEGDMTAKKG